MPGLEVDGEPLTCERIKAAIADVFTKHGMTFDEFIVSHGAQAAVGHDMGSGQIAAGEPVVIDLWPRDIETQCYADMTRTYVVGEPAEDIVRYHTLCKEALDRSLEAIRAGVPGADVFGLVCELFHEAGQPTQLSKADGEVLQDGFYHGLGHGVGLEVHEAPSLGRAPGSMVAGDVVTVEPGLYKHGLRRRAARGSRPRHRRRRREPHGLSVRPGAVSEQTIETLLAEERRYPPAPEFAAQANAQPSIYETPFEELWEREGRERVTWFEPFAELYEWELPYAKWYLGGKLNACFNCVDRHVEAGRGEKVAYYWEGEPEDDRREVTYADLLREVTRLANALKELGVGKGTPVAIYMGMVPELPVAMLACARLGAPHTVVFGGFSADSLSSRMLDMGCEFLITQDEAWRRGTTVPLKRSQTRRWATPRYGHASC